MDKKDDIFNKTLCFMTKNGKKAIAYKILYNSLKNVQTQLNSSKSIHSLLRQAVENAAPDIEVKAKRMGTNTYLVPRPLLNDRKLKHGIRNILESANGRKEYTMQKRLAAELIDSYSSKGSAVKKKEDIHRLAESNKSFAHFNW